MDNYGYSKLFIVQTAIYDKERTFKVIDTNGNEVAVKKLEGVKRRLLEKSPLVSSIDNEVI